MQVVNGIYLPDSDVHFAEALKSSLIVDGKATYQLSKLQGAMPHVKRKYVALDIGAHVGLWSMHLAKLFPTVHAFEPLPQHIECFRANTKGCTNVVLHQICLGSTNGIAGLMRIEDNSGNTRMSTADDPDVPEIASQHRLDDYAERIGLADASFIKIDVEGYEYAVVCGGEQYIKRCRPVMVVEQKPGHAERYGVPTGKVLDLLKGWGARIQWQRAGDFCLTWS